MPELGGFEATAQIRRIQADSSNRIPIAAMTANALEGDRESCLAARMDDYVFKPVEVTELKRSARPVSLQPLNHERRVTKSARHCDSEYRPSADVLKCKEDLVSEGIDRNDMRVRCK
jgi:CheY-like chemotaxis protein